MDRVERIRRRLPRFYRSWDEDSLISVLIHGISTELDLAEDKLMDVMKTKWVDVADGENLDNLASLLGMERFDDEDDANFRTRIHRAVDEYKGGGTVSAILDSVTKLIRDEGQGSVKVVENPPAPGRQKLTVRASDTWQISSQSIEDAKPRITITVKEGGEVSQPEITNIDTGESVTYDGKLGSNQTLILEKGAATLDGEKLPDEKSPGEIPTLTRWISKWKYSESLGKMVGVFDEAKFDEQTFAVGIPPVEIEFEWKRLQPSTFKVIIDHDTLESSDVSQEYLQKVVNSMKAAGTTGIVAVSEDD